LIFTKDFSSPHDLFQLNFILSHPLNKNNNNENATKDCEKLISFSIVENFARFCIKSNTKIAWWESRAQKFSVRIFLDVCEHFFIAFIN
jgi:hypothetical protein